MVYKQGRAAKNRVGQSAYWADPITMERMISDGKEPAERPVPEQAAEQPVSAETAELGAGQPRPAGIFQ